MKHSILSAAVHSLRASIRVLRIALATVRNPAANGALLRLDKAANELATALEGGAK